MARRQLVNKPKPRYEFADRVECEESPKYGGNHLVRPTQWPPKTQHGQTTDPSVSLQCERCGTWCIVYKDNNADDTSIEVVLPEKSAKESVPA